MIEEGSDGYTKSKMIPFVLEAWRQSAINRLMASCRLPIANCKSSIPTFPPKYNSRAPSMPAARKHVIVKRVYEKPARGDGYRVLVDRLWPRGLSKSQAALHAWLRDLAPSNELRRWFHTHSDSWVSFRKRYLKELALPEAAAALDEL